MSADYRDYDPHGDGPLDLFGEEERQLVEQLDELGAVIWEGRPGEPEYWRPTDWQTMRHSGNEDRLKDFRDESPTSCLCLNTGWPVSVVDVDVGNGGDIEKVRALLAELGVRIFVEIDTPGGGKHFYIRGHPDLPTVHSTEQNQRLPGYPGVDIQSFGANVFLPGTARRKHGGRTYTIVFNHLDELS